MKTRLKGLEAKTYQGKVTGHKVTLENGVEGYLDDKNSDKEIKLGDEVDYTVEVKQNKTTKKDYNLLTLKKIVSERSQNEMKISEVQTFTETKPTLTPTGAWEVNKIKAEACTRLMIKAMDMFDENKLDWDAVAEKQKYVTQLVWGEIDEIYGLG